MHFLFGCDIIFMLVRIGFGGGIMFVECVKNNGVPYLRLVQGVRVKNKDGYKVTSKKVVFSI